MKRFVFVWIYLFILFSHTCMFPACCYRQRTYMAHSLVNGILNETRTHSGLQFEWFSGENVFIWRPLLSFSVVTLVCFTPHLFLIGVTSIWSIVRTRLGATIPGHSGAGSDCSKGVLHIPQISSITGTSPPDSLVSYPGHIWWTLTALKWCCRHI